MSHEMLRGRVGVQWGTYGWWAGHIEGGGRHPGAGYGTIGVPALGIWEGGLMWSH